MEPMPSVLDITFGPADNTARSVAFIAQLRATTTMVDEPIADLSHADASYLWAKLVMRHCVLIDERDTYTGEALLLFLAGIRIRDILGANSQRGRWCVTESSIMTYLLEPLLHDLGRLLWEIASLSGLPVLIIQMTGHEIGLSGHPCPSRRPNIGAILVRSRGTLTGGREGITWFIAIERSTMVLAFTYVRQVAAVWTSEG
jgi:hypothetical protein